MIYGEKLKKLRKNNNIFQEDLCNMLDIKKSAYSQYENEYVIMPLKHLNILCNYYNVSFDYIFSFTEALNYDNTKNEIDKSKVGTRIKEFRNENKLTQIKLASILNIGNGTLAGYETGNYLIATPFLYTICNKYHISADYLLGKVDEPKYLK